MISENAYESPKPKFDENGCEQTTFAPFTLKAFSGTAIESAQKMLLTDK